MGATVPVDDVNRPLTYDDYALIPDDGESGILYSGDTYETGEL